MPTKIDTDAILTALRVLRAFTRRHCPDPVDLAELRRFIPSHAHASPDNLACGVIHEALRGSVRLAIPRELYDRAALAHYSLNHGGKSSNGRQ
jgi:hypothetical protein